MNQFLDEAKLKIDSALESGFKRLGAFLFKAMAVPMVPMGLGLMLYGLFRILHLGQGQVAPFAIGVTLTILGTLLWLLARKLDDAAHLLRYRRQQMRVVRLAQQRGGRLTATETVAEMGLTAQEAADLLRRLTDGGIAEIEVTDSGLIVYRFPEVLFAHEKPWSRDVESA